MSVYAKREPLTVSHPAREVGVLKRHGVGEGESEVGVDFSSFLLPRFVGKENVRELLSNTNFWIGTFLSRRAKRHNDRKSEKKASFGGRDIRSISP